MNRRFRIYCKSFHSIAELNQELIGSLQPDQARARVLSIKDDVYGHDGHHRVSTSTNQGPKGKCVVRLLRPTRKLHKQSAGRHCPFSD